MPTYQLTISKPAQKQLNKLPVDIADDLIETIYKLAENPRPGGCKKLKGRDAYRVRSGDYRIIYQILDKLLLVEVIAIGNRKDVYN